RRADGARDRALPEGAGIIEVGVRARADRDRAAGVCCCARSNRIVADPAPLRVPAEGGAAAIGEGVLPDRRRIGRGRRALPDRRRVGLVGLRVLPDGGGVDFASAGRAGLGALAERSGAAIAGGTAGVCILTKGGRIEAAR